MSIKGHFKNDKSQIMLRTLTSGDTFIWNDTPCLLVKWGPDGNYAECIKLTSGSIVKIADTNLVIKADFKITVECV